MLFSSENNCNSSIETIIKDKITLIDNNNINNNLINFNLTSNLNTLNNLNELNKLSLNNKTLNNNENANYVQHSICSNPSPSRPDNVLQQTSCSNSTSRTDAINPLLLSPLERENAKEIIQQKILDNVYITQKINKENQELVNYLTNIKEEEKYKNDNVLLSPIDFDLISNNSNNLLLNNDITTNNAYATPNLSVNQFISSPESNGLYLDSMIYSSPNQSVEESLTFLPTNELPSLENLIQVSPNALLTNTTTLNPVISTPNSQILSSPLNNSLISSPALTNTLISSPESNILSSPELYDTLSPELNLNNTTFNDLTVEEYLLNQEILKLQQENLMKSTINIDPQMTPSNVLVDQGLGSSPEVPQELLINNSLEPLALNLENISEIINDVVPEEPPKEQSQKRKFDEIKDVEEEEEEDSDREEEEKELENNKKAKKENVINEGKPFIYVVTESDDEDEESTTGEEDGQKKKKYKKKYYVCSVCNHKSKRHYNVEVHLKTHEKNRPKPFVCEICNKSFHRIHVLERHKIIHQEKIHSCELCGKKFGRLDSLKRHVGCKTCIKRQQLLKKEKN